MRSTAECFLIPLLFTLVLTAVGCSQGENGEAASPKAEDVPAATEEDEKIDLTVVYDNNPFLEGLKTAWGFSCLVEGGEKTVLFDTGGDGDTLMYNMSRLGIDVGHIDVVVISHAHTDHTGGLAHLLRSHPGIEVYLPASSPAALKDMVRSYGTEPVEVSSECSICEGIWSTGEMGTDIREQALAIETGTGLIMLTGCAHPGIVDMVRAVKDTRRGEIELVIGGFHLRGKSGAEIDEIIAELKALGVRHVGPCHCTGDAAIRAFSSVFGNSFIEVGVGKLVSSREIE
jgi:7,8-dihydropterin-6-yl-methyl-4-(beta-D-ribofuranosyl)aminobenzene 5'-phosphate synthase